MIAKATSLISMALLAMQAHAQNTEFTKECLFVSQEYGTTTRVNDVKFESTLDEVTDKLGDRVLFMRNYGIEICSDDHYIHGMQLKLEHDFTRDPEHHQFHEAYDPVRARIYHEHWIG